MEEHRGDCTVGRDDVPPCSWRYLGLYQVYKATGTVSEYEFSADIQFIGVQNGFWVAELIATVENKGKAQHRMEEFGFDVSGIEEAAPIRTSER